MTLFYRLLALLLFLGMVPVMACIGVCVLLFSGWPVLFAQKRTGKNGKPFIMYKFRTMTRNAEERKASVRDLNESHGPTFKVYDDPRFTAIGKFLSHTGIDELPQLWNMVTGDMALMGPRPLPVDEARRLEPWMKARHSILPGIISPAILTGTYHQDFTVWMKSDVFYATHKSPMTDIMLFLRFAVFVLKLFVTETAVLLRKQSGRRAASGRDIRLLA